MRTGLEIKKCSTTNAIMTEGTGVFPPSGHGRWVKLQTSGQVPSPRSGHNVVVIGNKAYMFGGCGCGYERNSQLVCLNDMYAFDLETNHWEKVKAEGNTPLPRTSFGMCAGLTPGKFIVAGGTGVDIHSLRGDIVEFDSKKKQWSQIREDSEDTACSFYGQSLCMYKNSLLLFGGSKGLHYSNDLYAYNIRYNLWRKVKTKGCKPSPRYKHQAVIVGDKMYVLGGGRFKPDQEYIDIYTLDLNTLEWEKVVDTGGEVPKARVAHTCCYDEDAKSIYTWGGFTSELSRLQGFCAYHVPSNRWRHITSIASTKVLNGAKGSSRTSTTGDIEVDSPQARAFHSAVFYNGSGANGDERYNDVWRFQVRSTPPSLATLGAHVLRAELLKQPNRRMKVHHGVYQNFISNILMMKTTSQELCSAYEGIGGWANRPYVARKRTQKEVLKDRKKRKNEQERCKRDDQT